MTPYSSEHHKNELWTKIHQSTTRALDPCGSLSDFAECIVHEFCDWCTIHLQESDGSFQKAAHAHRKPAGRILLGPQFQIQANSEWLRKKIQTGRPQLIYGDCFEAIRASTQTQEQAYGLAKMGVTSAIVLPLIAAGKTIGALSLFSSDLNNSFEEQDFPFLEKVAAVAANAAFRARAFQKAQSDIKLREQFVSIASHELKTPLTSLQSLIQLVLRRARNEEAVSSMQSVKMLENAEKQCQRMIKLIHDLLDMSRMSAGKLRLDCGTVNMVQLIHEIVDRMDPEFRSQGSRITVDGPAELIGFWDRSRIEEVVVNLLTNALKYGAGRPVRVLIEARAGVRNEDRVFVSVQDHGPGIPPEDQGRVFDLFERAAHSHDQLGHGLGLFIVRQILEAHQGNIRLESILGQGTTFTFDIPRVSR